MTDQRPPSGSPSLGTNGRPGEPGVLGRARLLARTGTAGSIVLAASSMLAFYRPAPVVAHMPFGPDRRAAVAAASLPSAAPSSDAFGRSGAVQVRFALPGDAVQYPLQVAGDPTALAYQWQRISDAAPTAGAHVLSSDTLVAPDAPGFYQLALVRHGVRRVVNGLTLIVLVPFEEKKGPTLDGYRIGTYLAERFSGARHERPEGFVKVMPENADLAITRHLRVADFLSHDAQTTWPRYAAVNARVLDKLELVIERLAAWRGDNARVRLDIDVHSGFRTPIHNRATSHAARDSRHQYGDAIDVSIDANGDGRLTVADAKMVVKAVDAVEKDFPELTGGVGLYTSRRYSHPYVHIDARGKRARWHS